MKTIIFYVAMTMFNVDGTASIESFEPMSWTTNSVAEEIKAYEECSILANAYDKLESTYETDCYEMTE